MKFVVPFAMSTIIATVAHAADTVRTYDLKKDYAGSPCFLMMKGDKSELSIVYESNDWKSTWLTFVIGSPTPPRQEDIASRGVTIGGKNIPVNDVTVFEVKGHPVARFIIKNNIDEAVAALSGDGIATHGFSISGTVGGTAELVTCVHGAFEAAEAKKKEEDARREAAEATRRAREEEEARAAAAAEAARIEAYNNSPYTKAIIRIYEVETPAADALARSGEPTYAERIGRIQRLMTSEYADRRDRELLPLASMDEDTSRSISLIKKIEGEAQDFLDDLP